jgi:K+-sensing histidine kinase KdpD
MILIRPARKLAEYARTVTENQSTSEIPKHLPQLHQEIAESLANLSNQAEQLRGQRKKFIEDVIEDVRPGLAALRRSADIEGAVEILSSSLEDLKQLAEISRMDQRMNSGVVDLSELLGDTCKRASRAGLCPEVRVLVPELPTWVQMDAEKIERAMIQILAKMGEMLDKGQSIEANLQVHGRAGLNGIEICFHSSGAKIPGAPEQEITRHWISQKGLALTLAQKVAKAHGGSIFASGLIGSPIQIAIKFPKTILTDGLVSPARYSPSKPLLDLDNFNTL